MLLYSFILANDLRDETMAHLIRCLLIHLQYVFLFKRSIVLNSSVVRALDPHIQGLGFDSHSVHYVFNEIH